MPRPKLKIAAKIKKQIFEFLDGLESMSDTNYAKYVQREFCLTWDSAKGVVTLWHRNKGVK